MEFQLTGAQFTELVRDRRRLFDLYPTEGDPLPLWRKGGVIDEKTYRRMIAVDWVMIGLKREGRNVTEVKRVICWSTEGVTCTVETFFHDFHREHR